jgi:hypothetical protein
MISAAGLWIDHRKAVIVYYCKDKITTRTIASNLEKHVRASGGSRSSTPYGPQDILAEDRLDRRYGHHLDLYYEEVARALHGIRSLLILGPGEAKGEFEKHLRRSEKGPPTAVTVETADKMTEPQIAARVKKHFSR